MVLNFFLKNNFFLYKIILDMSQMMAPTAAGPKMPGQQQDFNKLFNSERGLNINYI